VLAAIVAAGLALFFALTPATASAAGAKVDLTSCLAPGVQPGDVRVFETSEGSTLTQTVLDVVSNDGKSSTTTVQTQLASYEPTVCEIVSKPGKSVNLGDVTVGDLSIEVKKPKRWYPLTAVPGRTYSSKVKGKAYRGGVEVGVALLSGDWQLVGFESLTTPGGSFSDTAHVVVQRRFSVGLGKSEPSFVQESDVELWCVDGVGIVAASYTFRLFENGQLVGELINLDSWLVVAGVAVN
jgi:hypothetical protein